MKILELDDQEKCECPRCANLPRDPFPPIWFMIAALMLLFASYAVIKIHERTHHHGLSELRRP